jgi:hypothetical protein
VYPLVAYSLLSCSSPACGDAGCQNVTRAVARTGTSAAAGSGVLDRRSSASRAATTQVDLGIPLVLKRSAHVAARSIPTARAGSAPAATHTIFEARLSLVRDRGPDLAIYRKAWRVRDTGGPYAKNQFSLDFVRQLTCPAEATMPFQPGGTVQRCRR